MPAFSVPVSEDYRELREFHGLSIWENRRDMGRLKERKREGERERDRLWAILVG